MKSLIEILQNTTNTTILGLGLLNITMVLPVIPSKIPDLFYDFFGILLKIHYNFTIIPSSIHKQIIWFLQHLYGMFPIKTTKKLREIKSKKPAFITKFEVSVNQPASFFFKSPKPNLDYFSYDKNEKLF